MMDKNKRWVLAGTYTDGSSKGIYVYPNRDRHPTGAPVSILEIDNPSYIFPAQHGLLYAVSENSRQPSWVHSIKMDYRTGELTLLSSTPTAGAGPCYAAVTDSGRKLLTADYGGGTVSVYGLGPDGVADGPIQVLRFEGKGVDPDRQDGPHIHCTVPSPDGRYIFVTDLGTDHIYRYDTVNGSPHIAVNEQSRYPILVESGSGPRHLIFASGSNHAYLINELSGTINAYRYNSGELYLLQTVPTDTIHPPGGAHIMLDDNEKYLYASNRDINDGIVVYSVQGDGTLANPRYIPTDAHPRYFDIDACTRTMAVAAKDGGSIKMYSIDPMTGGLEYDGRRIGIESPVCVLFY